MTRSVFLSIIPSQDVLSLLMVHPIQRGYNLDLIHSLIPVFVLNKRLSPFFKEKKHGLCITVLNTPFMNIWTWQQLSFLEPEVIIQYLN